MSDELYWRLTPVEVCELLAAKAKRQEQEDKFAMGRAGLVAATIMNSKRTKKTDRVWTPADFLAAPDPVRVIEPAGLAQALGAWAATHNRKVAKA